MTAFDLPSLARSEATTGDATIRALFELWRRADAPDAPESETERVSEIEREIFDTPCGDVGDAIKLYLLAQNTLYPGPGGKLYSPAEPGVDAYDMEGHLTLDTVRSAACSLAPPAASWRRSSQR